MYLSQGAQVQVAPMSGQLSPNLSKRAQLRQRARAERKARVKYGPRNWKSWYRPGDQSEPPSDVPGRPLFFGSR